MTKIQESTDNIYNQIADLLRNARNSVVQKINQTMVITYFEIERIIVEEEQNGKHRANYGKHLIDDLSKKLSTEFGKGFSATNIKQMRSFYITYSKRQKVPDEFRLSWSHYLILMRIDDENERSFYEIGELKHKDIGQMQMYVNYYDREIKLENENNTIGIILCQDKNKAIVEYTLPEDNKQIFASKYQTILPSKEKLKQLIENKN